MDPTVVQTIASDCCAVQRAHKEDLFDHHQLDDGRVHVESNQRTPTCTHPLGRMQIGQTNNSKLTEVLSLRCCFECAYTIQSGMLQWIDTNMTMLAATSVSDKQLQWVQVQFECIRFLVMDEKTYA